MKIDIAKLKERLPLLTGRDFEQAELMERADGNNFPEVTFTKSMQARLAAHALEVPYQEIKMLPIKEYKAVCDMVFNFLFLPSDENATSSEKSES